MTKKSITDVLEGVDFSNVRIEPLRCVNCKRTATESNGYCWPQPNMGQAQYCQWSVPGTEIPAQGEAVDVGGPIRAMIAEARHYAKYQHLYPGPLVKNLCDVLEAVLDDRKAHADAAESARRTLTALRNALLILPVDCDCGGRERNKMMARAHISDCPAGILAEALDASRQPE